ncbi:steryl acetyl hydrolase 1 [Monosporozyma unispora]|nr:hypothetical protein C6P44_004407 [Kazachstania unispora]
MKLILSILFIIRILTVVPFRVVIELWNISTHSNWSFICNNKIWSRLFIREATSICDRDTIEHVLNPLFNWIGCLFMKPSKLSVLNQTIHYSWFYKPSNFNPRKDKTLIFVHGGGYALKFVPLEIIFLNHLSQFFPDMAIIIHDYSVSIDEQGQLPQQSYELKQLYKYLKDDIECDDITLFGESAGGHVVLYLLLLLQEENISLPKKVVVVSPWCNPLAYSLEGAGVAHYGVFDSLKHDHLNVFGVLLQVSKNYKDMIPINLEVDFQETPWREILKQTRMYISYGTHEILHDQIVRFSDRLKMASDNSTNLIIFRDLHGAHIDPIMHLSYRGAAQWSRISNVAPLVTFLES